MRHEAWTECADSPARLGCDEGLLPIFGKPSYKPEGILDGHYKATSERIHQQTGPILILHDTTEHGYSREHPEQIGFVKTKSNRHGPVTENLAELATCGFLLHASLAITTEGVPLGLVQTHFWSRTEFHSCRTEKKRINPTRVPIEDKESYRWLESMKKSEAYLEQSEAPLVHIGDREADIFEYYDRAEQIGTYFISRVCVNRLTEESSLIEEMVDIEPKFTRRISFFDSNRKKVDAEIEVSAMKVRVEPPVGKGDGYSPIDLTFISAVETKKPIGRKRIAWTFLTNLPVITHDDVINVLDWYKLRWSIEYFFKILKMELKTEDSKLRSLASLTNYLAIQCLLAWRIQWIVYVNRADQCPSPDTVFTDVEQQVLRATQKRDLKSTKDYIDALSRLGGHLGRRHDLPPGQRIISRGLTRLRDMVVGFALAQVEATSYG